jgi:tetratricopeptide (TPR) repeat protein
MSTNKDEWFTNDRWDKAEQEVFYKKLKRARSAKDFYIRGKASTLLFSKDKDKIKDAVKLFENAIIEFPTSDLLSSFYLQAARGYVMLSENEKAIKMFKRVIEVQEDKGVFVRVTNAWKVYSLFVTREEIKYLYEEILSVIEKAKIFLEEEIFVKHAVKAIIFHTQGKLQLAIKSKNIALKSLETREPGFANRPKLGLIEREKLKDIIEKLQNIKAPTS